METIKKLIEIYSDKLEIRCFSEDATGTMRNFVFGKEIAVNGILKEDRVMEVTLIVLYAYFSRPRTDNNGDPTNEVGAPPDLYSIVFPVDALSLSNTSAAFPLFAVMVNRLLARSQRSC
jgi:hypothetical protein